MGPAVGDKVRFREGRCAGEHGVIESVAKDRLKVRLARGVAITTRVRTVTNLSLAARKAWVSMPDRRVGRPPGSKLSDRVSVTLRIDRELWERFRGLESKGRIADRTKLINGWLREKLAALATRGR